MRRVLLLAALLSVLAGCGDDDESGGSTAPATTQDEPVASVPGLNEQMPSRCALEGRGVSNLSAEGVDCSEAERVLGEWLETCGGQDSPCQVEPGYVCAQERFAGARSDVECVTGDAAVRFSFG